MTRIRYAFALGSRDSQAVYAAASKLAESRGWQPPQQQPTAVTATTAATAEVATPTTAAPVPPPITLPPTLPTPPPTLPALVVPDEAINRPLTRWERYSAGLDHLPDKQRDFQVAKRAFADGLSKKQTISLLAKNSPRAQKLYHDEGSTPAYNYVEMVFKAAQQQSAQAQVRSKGQGAER